MAGSPWFAWSPADKPRAAARTAGRRRSEARPASHGANDGGFQGRGRAAPDRVRTIARPDCARTVIVRGGRHESMTFRARRAGLKPAALNIDSWRGPLFSVMARLDRATRRGPTAVHVPLRVVRSGAGHDAERVCRVSMFRPLDITETHDIPLTGRPAKRTRHREKQLQRRRATRFAACDRRGEPHGRSRRHHAIDELKAPPSRIRLCPTMNPILAEHRKAQASPNSAGSPARPAGVFF